MTLQLSLQWLKRADAQKADRGRTASLFREVAYGTAWKLSA